MQRPLTILLFALTTVSCGPAGDRPDASPAAETVGSIERGTPAFDAIVPSDAVIEVLAEGHEWTEGPVWVPALHGLLYSDIPANSIYLYRNGSGSEVWLGPGEAVPGGSGGSNGLVLDQDGALLLAQHGDRRIARLEGDWSLTDPTFVELAGAHEGQRLNSPNDLVQGPGGDLYFTDPPYGFAAEDEDPAKELDVNGVYRLAPDGALELIEDGLRRPNGVALSPDGSTLYVASSDGEQSFVNAYLVRADGSVGEGRRFADTWGDGLAVDRDGNLYVAGPPRGVTVFSPTGERLGAIRTGQQTSNVAWGDDGSTLYITADSYLMRIRLNAVGAGWPEG